MCAVSFIAHVIEPCDEEKIPLANLREKSYDIFCAWGYSSVGERSVRIRKAVSSNLIISIWQPADFGRLLFKKDCLSMRL